MAIADRMTFSFEAIGTHWQIDISEGRAPEAYDLLFTKIKERIEVFDRAYSRFRDDSLITRLSQGSGTFALPEDAGPLFDLYENLYRLTDGAFTPFIGSVLEEAGYDAHYSLKPRQINTPLAWDEALEYHFPRLTVKRPAVLDFGAVGKGYCIDLVGKILLQEGIHCFIIDAGGDILHHSAAGAHIRVGLEHPENPKQVIGVVSLGEGSICGSAGNRRAWGRFHHIIDPRTLTSPRDIISVWVTAADALHADALTTALYLGVLPNVREHFDFEYCILNADYTFDKSPGFKAEMFINETIPSPP